MGRGVFPPCCLAWVQTMIGVMAVMATSFNRTYARSVVLSAPGPAAGHCLSTPPLEIAGLSQASLVQSLVGTLLFSPGSGCTQSFVFVLQESVSSILWKFYNQNLLASKVKFPGGSQSLCQIPRLGNLLWVQRKAMPKNVQTTTQLHSSHMLAK